MSSSELQWKDERWTKAHQGMISSVFTKLQAANCVQLHLKGFESVNLCDFDKLRFEATQDYYSCKVSINKSEIKLDDVVQNQIISNLTKFFRDQQSKFPLLQEVCPYCKGLLLSTEHRKDDEDYENNFIVGLNYCGNCNYWCWHHLESRYIHRWQVDACEYTSLLSKIREFDGDFPIECSSEISQWMRGDAKRWHSISPRNLEKLVADIFRANYANADVIHVGKPDDGGVDVLFIDTDKHQWLIQVKRRERANYAEPVDTIRNLLGTLLLEGSLHGIVVSTADHFTYRAYQAASRASERGMTIQLIDRGKLDRMLDPLLVDRPWITPLREAFPVFVDYFANSIPSRLYRNKGVAFLPSDQTESEYTGTVDSGQLKLF